jgi:predicted small metal-binding protein|tara:strand:+ start:56 stop:214 length:159 start_codon:yes stop_codon:yes gene_type:complete
MVKAVCRDYGFNCDFICDGDLDAVVTNFGKHCTQEHGIEYRRETLMKYLLNK